MSFLPPKQSPHENLEIQPHNEKCLKRDSLAVQRPRLLALNDWGLGLVPGQGTRALTLQLKIPHVATKVKDSVSPS